MQARPARSSHIELLSGRLSRTEAHVKGTMQRRKFLRFSSVAAAAIAVPDFALNVFAQSGRASGKVRAKPQVPRWQPQDLVFNSHATPNNPPLSFQRT